MDVIRRLSSRKEKPSPPSTFTNPLSDPSSDKPTRDRATSLPTKPPSTPATTTTTTNTTAPKRAPSLSAQLARKVSNSIKITFSPTEPVPNLEQYTHWYCHECRWLTQVFRGKCHACRHARCEKCHGEDATDTWVDY